MQSKLYDIFLLIDLFSKRVEGFRTSHKSQARQSCLGALFSLIVIAVCLPEAFHKYIVLINKLDQQVSVERVESYYRDSPVQLIVGDDNNKYHYAFRVAVLVSELDSVGKSIPDLDRIGQLEMTLLNTEFDPGDNGAVLDR